MTTPDMHLDTGALALGALPDDEAVAVQEHLQTCESCSAELAGFRDTVAMLAAVSAEAPPASLRRSVMSRIAVTPQLPPLMAPAAPAPSAPPPADIPATDSGAAKPTTDRPDNVVPLRRWYRRPGALVAAAVAALVIGAGAVFGITQANQNNEVAQTPEQCVAQAADRQTTTPVDGQGSVVYAPSCSAVTIDVTGLPDLPDDRTYQLWALAGDQPRSLDVLPDASAGQPQLVTKPTQPGENAVAITVEPAGGSAAPTLPIIWQAKLGA